MKQSVPGVVPVALVFLLSCGLCGCGGRGGAGSGSSRPGESTGSQLSQLSCGNTIYRLSPDKIDDEVNGACDRVNKSYQLEQSNHATRVRFTCQDHKGHVVESTLVPNTVLEGYNRSCREYLAADEAFENGAADRSGHFNALRSFQGETNQLTRRTVEEANVIWRQNRADQALLNKLIKNRGGSIEIKD